MRLRFAPSPTGFLHVGNARLAVTNALHAAAGGGTILLRFDDTDAAHARADELVPQIEADLRWLGIPWDGSVRQSSRLDRYEAAADRLRAAGRLYPCFESEEELRFKREARLRARKPPVYDRGALRMTAAQRAQAEANGKRPYWRFRLSDATIEWDDLTGGTRTAKLTAVSDPVLIRADGTPLYTFASVVDDLELGITDILRGEDHVTNTGVQIDLAHALLATARSPAPALPFRFGHLPLLVDADGAKLSKRAGSVTLRTLRHDGVEPAALFAYLARLGTPLPAEPLPLASLAATHDLRTVSRASPRFDMRQLLALNRRVLAAEPFDAVADRLPVGATPAFWDAVRHNLDLLSEARHWWEVASGTVVPPPVEAAEDRAFLGTARDLLPPEPWDGSTWERWTAAVRERTGRRGRALFLPLRLALTGEEHGPELRALLPLIGRTRAVARLGDRHPPAGG